MEVCEMCGVEFDSRGTIRQGKTMGYCYACEQAQMDDMESECYTMQNSKMWKMEKCTMCIYKNIELCKGFCIDCLAEGTKKQIEVILIKNKKEIDK